ncbi:AlbA family DNA-binding domain-containing protein [Salidesulfovibrio brasiliensis]|uniref:AlbA family DNA-binding domain-containing protein n=1 Tax=Salidesulfovibrio brasiliensis TaxID=221711 RepID=UPI0006D0F392|nr:ATP-binding protein [Salidesulfovibrio brasiliensis]
MALQGRPLYKVLVGAVVLTALSVGLIAVWGVRSLRNEAASMAVKNAVQQLSGTVNVLVNVISEGGDQGQFSGLDAHDLQERVKAVMRDRPMIGSVLVSGDDGLELAVIRKGKKFAVGKPQSGSVVWNSPPEVKQPDLPTIDLTTLEGKLTKERHSLKPGEFSWTSAYRFHGHGESWMTISWLVGDGSRMLTFVLPVSAVVNQLSHADRGEIQELFVFWDSGKVMDIPRGQADEEYRDAVLPSELDDPVVAQATRMLVDDKSLRGETFSFPLDGEVWWAASRPLSAFGDTMYLGAAVAQSRVSTELTSDRFIYAFAVFIIVFGGAALYFLRRFRSRIEGAGLRRAYVSGSELRELIAEGESDRLEFKQTLRYNVKAGKNGREIELASIKTVTAFLNTNGGTLLIGVSDEGEILGLDDDKFENDDRALLHFTNLLGQHVGVKFQPFVNARAVVVDGKTVIRVNCVRADQPAFLINGQNEEFYVRSGPASRKLTVRQFYEYIRSSGKRTGGLS